MRPVVADTVPLNYLILIETVDILLRIFSPTLIPDGNEKACPMGGTTLAR